MPAPQETNNYLQNLVGDELPAETTVVVTTVVPDEVVSESVKEVTVEVPSAVMTMEMDTEVDFWQAETYCSY